MVWNHSDVVKSLKFTNPYLHARYCAMHANRMPLAGVNVALLPPPATNDTVVNIHDVNPITNNEFYIINWNETGVRRAC